METETMKELILRNLHPDTQTLLGEQHGTPMLVDLEAIVDLLNHVHQDPVASATLMLKYLMVLKNLYSTAKGDFERTRHRKEDLYNQLYRLYGTQDESNPYNKKAKLTAGFIEAAINESPEYKAVIEQTIELDNLVTRLYHIKDVVEEEYQLLKILVENHDSLPLSGLVVSKEVMQQKLDDFVQNMVFKEVPKPKAKTSSFKQVEYDEDDD